MRSAPTTTHPTRPEPSSDAAATSGSSVTGMPSCKSSQAVSLAPCSHGLVSSAKTSHFFPDSIAARTTPSAVPYPDVARPPALQCVRIPWPSGTSCAPWFPIARHAARSSSSTACASSSSASATSSADFPPRSSSARLFARRSSAQRRFTAVGRAARSSSTAAANARSGSADRAASRAAKATPYADAQPIAGAPRTTISRMARAASAELCTRTSSTRAGSLR